MPGFLNVLLAVGGGPIASGIDINDDDFAISPSVPQATNQVLANGDVEEGGVNVGNVLTVGDPADVEIIVNTVSGSVSTGTVGSYVALSTNPAWTLTRGSVGTSSYTATYDLRQISTGVVFFTGGTFALTAQMDV